MGDYMFMMESHLSADQFRLVGQMQEIAGAAGVGLYLTGGAVRDMLTGNPVRDLDFTIEGPALKIAKTAAQKLGGEILSSDESRKSAELRFPGGVTAEIGMAHTERFAKSGARPQITAATIHEDLRTRDFTINAIAFSLNKASLALLIDPANGVGDLERKEIRAIHNYSFYDEPSRMLRMVRFRIRMGYALDERTKLQYENSREADMLSRITPEALRAELIHISAEPLVHDVIQALDQEKMLTPFAPLLMGGKLNTADLLKLQKARQMVPFGSGIDIDGLSLLLTVLSSNWNAKETAAFSKASGLVKGDWTAVQKLSTAAKKLDRDLKNPKLQKPSQLYTLLQKTPGEHILHAAVYSAERVVHDRIKNYFQKYLAMADEVTDEMVAAAGAPKGSPKFAKTRSDLILKHLDARPKKVPPPPEPPPPPTSAFARGPIRRAGM